jgi:hypothetical protein
MDEKSGVETRLEAVGSSGMGDGNECYRVEKGSIRKKQRTENKKRWKNSKFLPPKNRNKKQQSA